MQKQENKKDYQVQFTLSKIVNLMFSTTYDPKTGKGDVIANVSIINKHDLNRVLEIFKTAMMSGLTVSPFIKILHEGESIGDLTIKEGKIGLATMCSITIDGILLKRGILVNPKFGGLVQIEEGSPVRFTDVLTYASTSIDPLEALMSQEITSVTQMISTGSGKILANLREVPIAARYDIDHVLSDIMDAGLSGILEVGEPNRKILDVPIERDHLGIVVIGGTNPMAIVREHGIPIETNAMSTIVDITEMSDIKDINL
ncbi:Protein of unknown function DUF128 [Methanohalobium evestigatum Z-7303]|uniref:NrpR regulatory domain-containing protein n=1 Tax=Methanohalobium evestigatum (strain ATCC BAA-1072 / DSM 3721 / NBRC 107634 / OCM 161 / Z-7303) TaxID=644295 RepID=D7EBR2_METEZ|nr:DUF128 domain-containing protein [Methanohalobium evestigatum]ADI74904.1 Protein of unknown function DUF128 [Methanohalobium evestigatum Z-7303]